ncbi:MAG: hypothetical protein IIA61_12560 [Candidatus Marinimicrobia bacterium]|nr:hypothetical protein [Candidatus Neomarinimicrobiota bacterium]
MLYRIISIVVICLSTSLLGQTAYISGGLTAQFGNGVRPSEELGDTLRSPYDYREHFLDVNAGYGDFSIWSSFEFSSPPQIGPDHRGIRKLRLSWESRDFSVIAGDLYGQIGRGLGLNLWEGQGIDWDSSLRGIWLKSQISDWLALDFISGTSNGGRHLSPGPGVDSRVRDFSDAADVSVVVATGSDVIPGLTLGGYIVNVEAKNPWFQLRKNFITGEFDVVDSISVRTSTTIPGIFSEYFGSNFDIYMEFMRRDHEIVDPDNLEIRYDKRSRGWAGYGSISYYPGRLGVTFEYKNYAYNFPDPEKRRYLPFNLGRRAPVQSPPTGFKEHTSTLLSRTPHVMDFEDEVGIQIETNYKFNSDLFIVLNYSQSSRHTGYGKVINADFSSDWIMEDSPTRLWFSSNEKFFPFREVFIEFNYHLDTYNLDIKTLISSSTEMIQYDESITEKPGIDAFLSTHKKETLNWEKRNLISIPSQLSMNLPNGLGLNLYWENQWQDLVRMNYLVFRVKTTGLIDSVITDKKLEDPFYFRYVSLTVGKPSKYSFGFSYDFASKLQNGQEFNTNPEDDSWLEALIRKAGVDLTNKWFDVQAIAYLTPSTILQVSYGSRQGGLKCDSGVCVFVSGIEDALTLTLTSNF